MKRFRCQTCESEVYFRNTLCLTCGSQLRYAPEPARMLAAPALNGPWTDGERAYRPCANHQHLACNWLTGADDPEPLCRSCRHNGTIPDLTHEDNLNNWRALELAKRHLFYSIIRWRLPAETAKETAEGPLVFDLIADDIAPDGSISRVLTGHDDGLITINIAEADPAERERLRNAMSEPYRTLIGHFRHEVGHYYWDRLIRDEAPALDQFRALFGDEREDYSDALKRHYENGPPPDWADRHISAYATSHPWEDWAETFAHYVHIVDALETARAFNIEVRPRKRDPESGAEIDFDPYRADSIDELIGAWWPVTVAINAVNRSMGQPDLYPFVLATPIVEKLDFVHSLVQGAGQTAGGARPPQ